MVAPGRSRLCRIAWRIIIKGLPPPIIWGWILPVAPWPERVVMWKWDGKETPNGTSRRPLLGRHPVSTWMIWDIWRRQIIWWMRRRSCIGRPISGRYSGTTPLPCPKRICGITAVLLLATTLLCVGKVWRWTGMNGMSRKPLLGIGWIAACCEGDRMFASVLIS